MKRYLLILLFLAGSLTSCRIVHDGPPDPGTPEPAPHEGVFACGLDSLFFNGDGRTIRWHFSQDVPDIGREGQGQYVFLFHNERWRYDAAEKFRIIAGPDLTRYHTFLMPDGPAAPGSITLSRIDGTRGSDTFLLVPPDATP